MCAFVCVCARVCICVSVYLCICVSVYMHVCMNKHMRRTVDLWKQPMVKDYLNRIDEAGGVCLFVNV
jgi:hypothetical protein